MADSGFRDHKIKFLERGGLGTSSSKSASRT